MKISDDFAKDLIYALRNGGLDLFYSQILMRHYTYTREDTTSSDDILSFLEEHKDTGILQDPDVIGDLRFADASEVNELNRKLKYYPSITLFTPAESVVFVEGVLEKNPNPADYDEFQNFSVAIDTSLEDGDYFIYKEILFRVNDKGVGVSLDTSHSVEARDILLLYNDNLVSIDLSRLFRTGGL